MDYSLLAFTMGLPPFGRRRRSNKSTKKTKKKKDNWFETLNVTQLKDLCKAGKLKISGTKPQLCQRLLENDYISRFGWCKQYTLKNELKEQMLVQSGTKYDQVLRLVKHEFGTGQAKRAATDTITDSETGVEKQVLKKRKINPKPETMYARIEKKIKSVSQKKYQTNYGSKSHCPDVFEMLTKLMKEFCIESEKLETDPMLAFRVAKAGWSAIYDFWQLFERPGYGDSQDSFDTLQIILLKVTNMGLLSKQDIEDMVVLLENLNACFDGYGLNKGSPLKEGFSISDRKSIYEKYDYSKERINIVEQTIRVIMPDYDKESRPTEGKSKALECDIRGLCALNGIPYPNEKK